MVESAVKKRQPPPFFDPRRIADEMIKSADEEEKANILENKVYKPFNIDNAPPTPKLIIKKWMRFKEKIDFKRALLNLVSGPRGQGKSALLEVLAWLFIQQHGAKGVIDLFSARDSEGMGWVRQKDLGDSVLLIHGNNTKIACEYDTVQVGKVKLEQMLEYKLVITVPKFYRTPAEEFESAGRLLRLMWDRDFWDVGDLRVLNFREGINIGSSRLSLGEKSGQSDAKAQFVYALNQFRHAGFAVNLDCLRLKSIDINIREIADYIWLKHQGIFGLTEDLRFLYKKYDLIRDFMRLPKYGFVLVSLQGGFGHGVFQRPYWHKETNENILKITGIESIVYDDEEEDDTPESALKPFDHVKLLEARLTLNKFGKPTGTHEIAEQFKISSATAANHIKYHNNEILQRGECSRCRKAKSNLSKTIISKEASSQRNPESTLPSTKEIVEHRAPTEKPVLTKPEPIFPDTPPPQPPQTTITKSTAKPEVQHEDEANLEFSPFYGENNTGD